MLSNNLINAFVLLQISVPVDIVMLNTLINLDCFHNQLINFAVYQHNPVTLLLLFAIPFRLMLL